MRQKKDLLNKSQSKLCILKLHNEKTDEFKNKDKIIKDYNIKINKYKNELILLEKKLAVNNINDVKNSENESNIEKLNNLIKELNIKKEDISSGRSESDYFLNTYQLINNYIRLEEEETIILNKDNNTNSEELHKINKQKKDIIDEYMKYVDVNYVTYRNLYDYSSNYCKECNNALEMRNGFAICPDCGLCNTRVIHESDTLSWQQTQEMDYRPQFTYDRVTHLDEWLRRFQAKEHRNIPQEIIDKVILEAHKERIKDLNQLTEDKVKKYLKKLELKDYYDNVISIINRINKRQSFVLTPEIESKIKEMFKLIQIPFEKYKPKNRKSMLSYSYLLNKFFLILDLPEFSKYFFLLKSADKLRQQDEIFKKIIDEMAKIDPKTNWVFYPSF